MFLLTFVTGNLLSWASAHETSDKLYQVRHGAHVSYIFAGKPEAWVPGQVPEQLKRVVERSRVLIFEMPFWDKARMDAVVGIGNIHAYAAPEPVLARVSAEAREAVRRIVAPEWRRGLAVPRAGMILSLVQAQLAQRVSEVQFNPGAEPDARTGAFLREWTREVFGRELDIEELRVRARAARDRARTGRVLYEHAILRLGVARGLPSESLLYNEPFTNVHERNDRFITPEELDQALVYYGQQLDAVDAAQRLRWHALSLIPIYVNAEYLTIRNEAVLRVMDRSPERVTPGLERLNTYGLTKHRYWRDRLIAHFAKGDVFVAVPLVHVLGRPNLAEPGLKRTLEDAGLEVESIEMGCDQRLH